MQNLFKTIAIIAALLPGTSQACEILEPFAVEALAASDAIIVGRMLNYQQIADAPDAALVTIEVDQVIKGEASDQMVLIWNAGLAMGPQEDLVQGRVVIGIAAAGRAETDWFADARPDLPMIIQPHCGEVLMQPATPALLAQLRTLTAP